MLRVQLDSIPNDIGLVAAETDEPNKADDPTINPFVPMLSQNKGKKCGNDEPEITVAPVEKEMTQACAKYGLKASHNCSTYPNLPKSVTARGRGRGGGRGRRAKGEGGPVHTAN